MAKLFLLLGGNMGDKAAIFAGARKVLREKLGDIVHLSSVYETEPWGFESDDLFWNQVIVIETGLSPGEILAVVKDVERQWGRVTTKEKYCSRPIDIDLLFYDDMVVRLPGLELPHPRMLDRRFVLEPLAEIASGMIHPVFRQTIGELLEKCTDNLAVKRLEPKPDKV